MTRFLIVLACVLALVAFGCGSSTETESTTPVDDTTEEPSDPIGEEEPMAGEEEEVPPVETGEEEEMEEEGEEEDFE